MSKKRSNVELPDVANMDDLAMMGDEELAERANRLEGGRRRAASVSSDLRPWEVEVAYVRREQGLRAQRAAAHAEFVRLTGGESADLGAA